MRNTTTIKVGIDEDQYVADILTGELKAVQARMRALRAQEQTLIDERLTYLRRINAKRRTGLTGLDAVAHQVVGQ